MEKREIIKDVCGNWRGTIREGEDGRRSVYDKTGNRLGGYRTSTNTTYDKWGNRVSIGNTLTNFIP